MGHGAQRASRSKWLLYPLFYLYLAISHLPNRSCLIPTIPYILIQVLIPLIPCIKGQREYFQELIATFSSSSTKKTNMMLLVPKISSHWNSYSALLDYVHLSASTFTEQEGNFFYKEVIQEPTKIWLEPFT
jgi:hypothetical protein